MKPGLQKISAIVCAARAHGEAGVIVRLLTEGGGLIAAYVAGGRGRELRPVLIPGNLVMAEIATRAPQRLPFARIELVASRGPWLSEPLPAAAINWATALAGFALPEAHPYPPLYAALSALLDAVCQAPSARGWLPGMIAYERLMLRELGYGAIGDDAAASLLARFDGIGRALARHIGPETRLAQNRGDVMAARERLRGLLARIDAME